MSYFHWGYFLAGFIGGLVLGIRVVIPWLERKGWL